VINLIINFFDSNDGDRGMFSCGRLNVICLYKDSVRNALKAHHVSTTNTSQ